jgi:predicted ArsR family transcriptional regulator
VAELSDAKRRIVEVLKRVESASAHDLAGQFSTTTTAVRQHLEALEQAGLVERFEGPIVGRGRPALRWRTTALATELFPDRHGQLTVELLQSVRASLGDAALQKVIDQRSREQSESYRAALGDTPVPVRVRTLAERRSEEGYLAEVVEDDGDLVLIEHHCPICVAATSCQGLCRSELEVFQEVLGPTVKVTREQHLLSGDTRCAYRISDTGTVTAKAS